MLVHFIACYLVSLFIKLTHLKTNMKIITRVWCFLSYITLQSVVFSYLYGGFPAHLSPTSCALTAHASSFPSFRHNSKTGRPHFMMPERSYVLSDNSAQNGLMSCVTIKFEVVCGTLFQHRQAQISVEHKHQTTSLFLTNRNICTDLLIWPEALTVQRRLWCTLWFRNCRLLWAV